jgi:hypothetical protein
MSQTPKVHKLTIRQGDGGVDISTSASLLVELDGRPIKGLRFLKFEAKACNIVKVQMEMYVNLDLDINVSDVVDIAKIKEVNDGVNYAVGQYEAVCFNLNSPAVKKENV